MARSKTTLQDRTRAHGFQLLPPGTAVQALLAGHRYPGRSGMWGARSTSSMNTYHWDAKDYAQHSQAQQTWARELIAKPGLAGTADVHDPGCGVGKVTAEIAEWVANGAVVGIMGCGFQAPGN